ncbi:MAG: hypothetical protein ACMG6E_01140 [Candidatus Roizmanbacteria bacterium]
MENPRGVHEYLDAPVSTATVKELVVAMEGHNKAYLKSVAAIAILLSAFGVCNLTTNLSTGSLSKIGRVVRDNCSANLTAGQVAELRSQIGALQTQLADTKSTPQPPTQ